MSSRTTRVIQPHFDITSLAIVWAPKELLYILFQVCYRHVGQGVNGLGLPRVGPGQLVPFDGLASVHYYCRSIAIFVQYVLGRGVCGSERHS